jgi:hypothetical protein
MADAEASRRDSERAANRARFPELAKLIDEIGPEAKLIWAQDECGEIGRRPALKPNEVEIERIPPMWEPQRRKR